MQGCVFQFHLHNDTSLGNFLDLYFEMHCHLKLVTPFAVCCHQLWQETKGLQISKNILSTLYLSPQNKQCFEAVAIVQGIYCSYSGTIKDMSTADNLWHTNYQFYHYLHCAMCHLVGLNVFGFFWVRKSNMDNYRSIIAARELS